MSRFVNGPFSKGTILGHYELLEPLGEGGYGYVWKGRNTNTKNEEFVAIKVFTTKNAIQTFQREVGIHSRWRHPNIIKLLDFGSKEDFPYIVMPLAQGTLEERYPLGKRLSHEQIIDCVSQISDGLHRIHGRFLAHGDLKPANVLYIKRDNKVTFLLSDFGFGHKILSTSRTSGTLRNIEIVEIDGTKTLVPSEEEIYIAGTYPYMAPEQFRSDSPSAESDQYALAIMVYRWICGELPFNVPHPNKMASSQLLSRYEHFHVDILPESLLVKVPELPPKVDKVVRKALSKNRKSRFGNILEFKQALSDAFNPNPIFPMRRKVVIGSVIVGGAILTLGVGVAQYFHVIQLLGLSALPPAGPPDIVYKGHTASIRSLAWSPDDTYIASSSDDRTAQVWDATTGVTRSIYRGHSSYVEGIAWSPDGTQVASSSADGTVQIWSPLTGVRIATYNGHINTYPGSNTQKGAWVNRISWSPDGKYIASGDQTGDDTKEATVQVWDVETLKRVVTYRGHMNGVCDVAWSPNGTYIASCGYDKSLQIWEGLTGKLITKYPGNNDLLCLSWSPDNKYVAFGGSNKEMWVINAYSGYIKSIHNNSDALQVTDVSWSSDNTSIAIGEHIATNNAATIEGPGEVEVFEPFHQPTFTRGIYEDTTGVTTAVAWSHNTKRIAFGDTAGVVQIHIYNSFNF